MTDLVTAGATAGTIYSASKILDSSLVQKILGPSAEYLGDQLKLFTQKNTENLKSIFQKAEEKLPEGSEHPGSVPPQVIRDVVFDGSFCEDEISQEYYAGVLVSSKTENPMNNIGKTITATIRNLSTYQITAHYILYGIIWFNYRGHKPNQEAHFIDLDNMLRLFDFPIPIPEKQKDEAQALLDHILTGLEKYNLIKNIVDMNAGERLRESSDKGWYPEQYWYQLTPVGTELFLWATGNGGKPLDYFYSKDCEVYDSVDIDFNDYL